MAIDITTGRFNGGSWKWLAFKETGASGVQSLVSKTVINDATRSYQTILIKQIVLGCATGHIHVYDGSGRAGATFIVNADGSYASNSNKWDFEDDPLELTNADGTDLCISASGDIYGFIKYGWGSI
jgi:hypothetical protein